MCFFLVKKEILNKAVHDIGTHAVAPWKPDEERIYCGAGGPLVLLCFLMRFVEVVEINSTFWGGGVGGGGGG